MPNERFPLPRESETNLEIVSEGPIAEHFEKCVMVAVLPDNINVVVLPSNANALLRIDGVQARRLYVAQENVLELRRIWKLVFSAENTMKGCWLPDSCRRSRTARFCRNTG